MTGRWPAWPADCAHQFQTEREHYFREGFALSNACRCGACYVADWARVTYAVSFFIWWAARWRPPVAERAGGWYKQLADGTMVQWEGPTCEVCGRDVREGLRFCPGLSECWRTTT